MRKIALLTIILILGSLLASCAKEDEVTVILSDAGLEVAIREAIGKPAGSIYASDLQGLTSFHASGRAIANITGLEYCVNLTLLELNTNQISNLSPLQNLASLTERIFGRTR